MEPTRAPENAGPEAVPPMRGAAFGAREALSRFMALEAFSGIVMFAAAVAAMLAANSPWGGLYDRLFDLPVVVLVGDFGIDKPLLLWINDGLMAVFFCLVGLEIKRELMEGHLSDPAQAGLPLAAAAGGMLVPAGVYAYLNWGDPAVLRGWAIPTATDIAFALGVLSLLGGRVPPALKAFLLALAIFDDLGAIVIIAAFYAEKLSLLSLALAGFAFLVLVGMNRAGVRRVAAYVLVGTALWLAVLKSGVHATLAGVLLALAVPIAERDGRSPLRDLEEALHPWVAYGVLPAFAFGNAGVSLAGVAGAALLDPLTLGIALGLFLGKQAGVLGAAFLVVKLGLARLPEGTSWTALYGAALVAGVGFTMSLFIGTLAFDEPEYAVRVRLGVLLGSLASAALGYAVLRLCLAGRARSA